MMLSLQLTVLSIKYPYVGWVSTTWTLQYSTSRYLVYPLEEWEIVSDLLQLSHTFPHPQMHLSLMAALPILYASVFLSSRATMQATYGRTMTCLLLKASQLMAMLQFSLTTTFLEGWTVGAVATKDRYLL